MKSKTKVLFLLTLLTIFLFSSVFNNRFSTNIITNNNYIEFNENNQVQINQSGFWNLTGNPIYIDDLATGVGAHNWTWAEIQPWCSGSGSWAEPYVIENVTIDGQGSGNCIEIKNSDAYFIIQNCSLYNSDLNPYYAGIKLNYIDNGKIINTTCKNNFFGIFLDESNNNTLSGNNANYNYQGIRLWDSNNTMISGNNASNNHFPGIRLWNSNNNTLSGNNASNNNDHGIYLSKSNNNTLSGNNASYNYFYGIFLDESNNNTLSGNTANNNRLGIILGNCNNSLLSGNNASNNIDHGIILGNCNNSLLSGNTASYNQQDGIGLYFSENNTISGNNASNNIRYGLYLSSSNNTKLSGNTASNNIDHGIYLLSSNNNKIILNHFTNNEINAEDNGINNTWDDGFTGNYWDDYEGVDANDDGIGDTPYIVPGTAGSQDSFPIWTDGDDITPVITIILPLANSIFGLNAPNYNISIEELNLDTIWYTLDGGGTNYTITDLTGTFNQLAWGALSEGNVTIRFYANDTAGNIGSAAVTVKKDIAPVITIIFPLPDSVFGLVAPNYNISIDELNLDTIWYTLDGGVTNYTITALTGTFNQTAWGALSEGNLTIRFYANDTAGNIGFIDVEVIIEIPENLPIISFGNYYLLFTFIAILSFIILEKRKKK
jgi:parallel beta-helix repeat protein